jgi:hypothetical protein
MEVKGKYFLIVNEPTGLVLDVKDASQYAGTAVIMWKRLGNDNQVWFQDPLTGTICNKHNNLYLDIDGSNRLVVNHYQPGEINQQWRYSKHRQTIENRVNANKVLDIADGAKEQGAHVCQWDYHGGDNQKWNIEPMPVKYFFIRSALNGKVLDIDKSNTSPGTKVIMYEQKDLSDADNQLWFEDFNGNIRSKLDENLVLDASGSTLQTAVDDASDNNRRFWCIQGSKIVNRYDTTEVLDIKASNQANGAELCAWKYHGGKNQNWHFEFV